ncbi:unnamed protein product [Ambrosiozyma monospora]|uniref:Unnamed protein product n=1 Tax=Ambrosiozyma monospora TaxID=43982 RepID=A0ACB5STF3_AMBMO|nr:unnamed protein product [Ambrosiozyma monospora]
MADPGIFQSPSSETANRQTGLSQSLTNGDSKSKKGGIMGKLFKSTPKRKVYIVLGKSPEVGIRHQKSKEAWLMEKLSILNKKSYADKHGYELILVNSLGDNVGLYQKRYQHEHREGWEKWDVLRKIMKQTPVEGVEQWFWYLDIHTLIMEPELSIEQVVFKKENDFYRDLRYFNPNNLIIDEELNQFLLGSTLKETKSLNSVDLLLTQDCQGINLNSFLIKRSDWSNLLLDLIWDPVFYSQMHAQWAKPSQKSSGFRLQNEDFDLNGYNNDLEEKNCLEYLFNTQNWVRSKIGFMPIRAFNSLSQDFCAVNDEDLDDIDEFGSLLEDAANGGSTGGGSKSTMDYLNDKANFHYNETNSDFIVNYMNCEKHHNCWDRFLEFSGLYEDLHKSWYKKWF